MTEPDHAAADLITLYPVERDIWRFDLAAFVLGFGLCALAGVLTAAAWWRLGL